MRMGMSQTVHMKETGVHKLKSVISLLVLLMLQMALACAINCNQMLHQYQELFSGKIYLIFC